MLSWQRELRSGAAALAGVVLGLGAALWSPPATAQVTIGCVSNKLGLLRVVEDASQCRFWETPRVLGSGDGGGVKFVFVTSEAYTGNLVLEATDRGFGGGTGLEASNFLCNRLAGIAGLPGTYVTWLSAAGINAVDRMPDPGGPWFNVKGELVAASLGSLLFANPQDEFLYNPVRYTEDGQDTQPSNTDVWTSTDGAGDDSNRSCLSWTSEDMAERADIGQSDEIVDDWTFAPVIKFCNSPARLYCFQE